MAEAHAMPLVDEVEMGLELDEMDWLLIEGGVRVVSEALAIGRRLASLRCTALCAGTDTLRQD